MNFGALFGFVLIFVVVYFGAIAELPAKELIFNKTSILLVLGGTIAAFFISFPISSMHRIQKLLLSGFFGKRKKQKVRVVREIVEISKAVHQLPKWALQKGYCHHFLKEGVTLVLDESLDDDDIEYVLRQRANSFKREYNKDAKLLVALAKFPPAFGLLGSVTGIIAMLMNLGTAGKEIIGQGMAIALLTTFWGVAIANMIILPFSDFAVRSNKDDEELREIIVEGLLLIRAKEPPATIARKLRSLLSLRDRQALSGLQVSAVDSLSDLDKTQVSRQIDIKLDDHG
ncbi:hypothetical protein GW916_12570 [bacterium]|nr:hypothetical protein [bacterium]